MAMAIAKTYQGYFTGDVNFVTNGTQIKLPSKRRVVVSIEDEVEATAYTTLHDRQVVAVKKFLKDVAELKDEDNVMTDADWNELANIRARTNVGFSRKIEL